MPRRIRQCQGALTPPISPALVRLPGFGSQVEGLKMRNLPQLRCQAYNRLLAFQLLARATFSRGVAKSPLGLSGIAQR